LVKRNVVVLAVVIATITAMLVAGKYMARRSGSSAKPATMAGSVRGLPAPDFELKTVEGKVVRLSDFRGKAVLLNFWATWCPPCKIEMPWFVDLQKQYGPQGLQVVGVAMDDAGPETIARFLKEQNVNYTVVLGTEAVGNAYGGVEALPTTFYIGRDGKIVNRVFGLVSHSEIEDNIRAALKQGAVGAVAASQTPAGTVAQKDGSGEK
jgi:cytochrome c biogenesis protein CcmG/thiol:disulfide interchange protein DsbE